MQRKYLPGQKKNTHSDTEVLLHLYRKLGVDFVYLLDGMFAFVMYCNGEYFMAHELLGIKPLYYYKIIREHHDNPFLFNTMGYSRSL